MEQSLKADVQEFFTNTALVAGAISVILGVALIIIKMFVMFCTLLFGSPS